MTGFIVALASILLALAAGVAGVLSLIFGLVVPAGLSIGLLVYLNLRFDHLTSLEWLQS